MNDGAGKENAIFAFEKSSIFLDTPISFDDFELIKNWAEAQIVYIQNLFVRTGGAFNGRALHKPYEDLISLISSDPIPKVASINEIFERISNGETLSASSKIGRLFNSFQLDVWERCGFLCAALNLDIIGNSEVPSFRNQQIRFAFASGYVLAGAAFMAGNSAFSPSREKIDDALQLAFKRADLAEKILMEQGRKFQNAEDLREQQIASVNGRIEQFVLTRAKRLAKLRKEHAEEMRRLRRSFEEYTALSEPIKYWEERATSNYVVAFCAMLVFIAIALFVIWRLEVDGPLVLSRVAAIVKDFPERAQSPFSFLALLSVPTLLVLWLLKFPARLFKEHLHIANDARRRKILITTYLSLLREPTNPISPAERQFALQGIFGDNNSLAQDDPIPVLSELAGRKLSG